MSAVIEQTTEIAERHETMPTIQSDAGLNPLVAAVLGGQDIDPEKLDKLLAVQERYEANQARKAYAAAMAGFREDAPDISKDSHVNYTSQKGTTDYRHASLGGTMSVINPILGKHGLNPSWTTTQNQGQITVTCRVTHAMGHFEETSLSAAADPSGGKNHVQAIGSTVSYLNRYTLYSICGLASSDQDDDGRGSEKEEIKKITDEQAMQIHSAIDENGLNKDKFIQWIKRSVKADSIEEINANGFPVVMTQIKRSIEKHNAANK